MVASTSGRSANKTFFNTLNHTWTFNNDCYNDSFDMSFCNLLQFWYWTETSVNTSFEGKSTFGYSTPEGCNRGWTSSLESIGFKNLVNFVTFERSNATYDNVYVNNNCTAKKLHLIGTSDHESTAIMPRYPETSKGLKSEGMRSQLKQLWESTVNGIDRE